jgi:hypothetical protein
VGDKEDVVPLEGETGLCGTEKTGEKRTKEIADDKPAKRRQSTQQVDGMEDIQKQLLRLQQQQEKGNVENLLAQVRTLAMRPHTENDLLIASLENLSDAANLYNHADAETFKLALKACRENSASGKLHGLVIKLLGTDAAKKAQVAIEGWRKAAQKASKEKDNPTPNKSIPVTGHNVGSPQFPQNPWYSPFPTPFGQFAPRPLGRGRGRGMRPYMPRQCLICKSGDHLVSACPFNTFNKDKST